MPARAEEECGTDRVPALGRMHKRWCGGSLWLKSKSVREKYKQRLSTTLLTSVTSIEVAAVMKVAVGSQDEPHPAFMVAELDKRPMNKANELVDNRIPPFASPVPRDVPRQRASCFSAFKAALKWFSLQRTTGAGTQHTTDHKTLNANGDSQGIESSLYFTDDVTAGAWPPPAGGQPRRGTRAGEAGHAKRGHALRNMETGDCNPIVLPSQGRDEKQAPQPAFPDPSPGPLTLMTRKGKTAEKAPDTEGGAGAPPDVPEKEERTPQPPIVFIRGGRFPCNPRHSADVGPLPGPPARALPLGMG